MRRLVLGAFVSLDGMMQAPGAPEEDASGGFAHGGWLVPHFDADVGAFMDRMMGGAFELLLARRTYDIMAAHWPRAAGDPFADRLNAMRKHVVTHSAEGLVWENSHRLAGIEAVAALKGTEGPELIVQGSGTLHGPLLAAGLVDRLFLVRAPVVLGAGKRALGGQGRGAFRLVEATSSASGVVMSVHDRDGAVRSGSFALGDRDGEA